MPLPEDRLSPFIVDHLSQLACIHMRPPCRNKKSFRYALRTMPIHVLRLLSKHSCHSRRSALFLDDALTLGHNIMLCSAEHGQGVENWSVSDRQPLLFDPAASELVLLDLSDEVLLRKIYSDNGSGWIKIAVVRDPVTRMVSAYLDYLRLLSSENVRLVPTFADVVEYLQHGGHTSLAFRPASNTCGAQHSPFDIVIPFETLQVSLPCSLCHMSVRSHACIVLTIFGKFCQQPSTTPHIHPKPLHAARFYVLFVLNIGISPTSWGQQPRPDQRTTLT